MNFILNLKQLNCEKKFHHNTERIKFESNFDYFRYWNNPETHKEDQMLLDSEIGDYWKDSKKRTIDTEAGMETKKAKH